MAKGRNLLLSLLFSLCIIFTSCQDSGFLPEFVSGEKTDYNNTITALDVGQAACTLIESDGRFCLIDAGSAGGTVDVSSYLRKRKVRTIDLLVLSHFHYDHTSEALEIIRNFDVKTVLIPTLSPENTPDSYLYQSLQADSANGYFTLEYARKNKEFRIGSGTVKVLADTLNEADNPNNTSVVLSYTMDDFVYVNTADMERNGETDYLLPYLPENITLFAAGHHGSQYSNTARLLEKLSPDFVTISCGRNNEYGHPHKALLNRLDDIGADYSVTAERGNIVYSIANRNIIPE